MRKNGTTLFSYALAAALLFGSCKKADDKSKCPNIPTGPDCQPLLEGNDVQDPLVFIEGRHLRTVSCNPNNDNEFVFWASGPDHAMPNNDTLFVYNNATGAEQKILVATMWYPPQWGRNGWILLGLAGGNLAMVKPNGDSLTDISKGRGSYHHPAWNASGTSIFASLLDGPDVLLALDGTVTDSFHIGGGTVDFIDDDRILTGYDIFTISTRQYVSTGGNLGAWSRMISAVEYVTVGLGIFKTNIANGQTITLKKSCNSRVYMNTSVNSSKTKVFATHVKSRLDTCGLDKLYEDYEIVEMNTDGTSEREIPIPE